MNILKMPQMAREGKNQYGDPKPKKRCPHCKKMLRQSKFSYIDRDDITKGHRPICKKCSAIKAEKERERRKNNWKYKPSMAMFNNSKQRAKNAGLEHSILIEDILIPDYCPVLKIKLETGDRKNHNNAPSIDRLDNQKGYVRDNIIIMSCRANIIKKDASLDELIMLGEWASEMKKSIGG